MQNVFKPIVSKADYEYLQISGIPWLDLIQLQASD